MHAQQSCAAPPPPQVVFSHRVTRASDMYSFGVLLWRALTGRPVLVQLSSGDRDSAGALPAPPDGSAAGPGDDGGGGGGADASVAAVQWAMNPELPSLGELPLGQEAAVSSSYALRRLMLRCGAVGV
jgi:serine/threonine protein kinase